MANICINIYYCTDYVAIDESQLEEFLNSKRDDILEDDPNNYTNPTKFVKEEAEDYAILFINEIIANGAEVNDITYDDDNKGFCALVTLVESMIYAIRHPCLK